MPEQPTINAELPPANATLEQMKSHLASLIESYGRGYTTSPTAGPKYVAAITATADLITAKEIARAVEMADANARKQEGNVVKASWALVIATTGLILATLILAAATWLHG